jgi:hypothetical protein
MLYNISTYLAQIDVSNLPQPHDTSNGLRTIINIILLIMGAVAVLIITISGFRYIISRGNPQEVAKAKDGILYAVIGLVVIILAFIIVGFVARSLT